MKKMLEKRNENEAVKLASTSTRFHSALTIYDFSPSLAGPVPWSWSAGDSDDVMSCIPDTPVLHPTTQSNRRADARDLSRIR